MFNSKAYHAYVLMQAYMLSPTSASYSLLDKPGTAHRWPLGLRCHLVASSVAGNIYAVPASGLWFLLSLIPAKLPVPRTRSDIQEWSLLLLVHLLDMRHTLRVCRPISDWEWKFHDFFALGSESATSFSFPGTKVPRHFRSRERKFHRWNFRSICGRAVIFTLRKIRSCDWLIWHSLRARWIVQLQSLWPCFISVHALRMFISC